jgi:hypothetical protein
MIDKTMCEVLWRNISDFYVNLRVEVAAVLIYLNKFGFVELCFIKKNQIVPTIRRMVEANYKHISFSSIKIYLSLSVYNIAGCIFSSPWFDWFDLLCLTPLTAIF